MLAAHRSELKATAAYRPRCVKPPGGGINWHAKGTWTDNDTDSLEIIMADGDDSVWQSCTQACLKYPDRNRMVNFLVDRVLHYTLDHEPLNYFQVLGMAKDTRAISKNGERSIHGPLRSNKSGFSVLKSGLHKSGSR